MTVCVSFFATAMAVNANDVPEPDGAPVDVSDVDPDPAAASNRSAPRAAALVYMPPGYQSAMLKGEFRAQWMSINYLGKPTLFWGARIVSLDPASPLRQLGLNVNDVITRVDGVSIGKGMTKDPTSNTWNIAEMENHYGLSKIRYIFHKTQVVRETAVNLGPHHTTTAKPPGPPPIAP